MISKILPNIHFPASLEDAIQLLSINPDWKPLAGSTDIFPAHRTGRDPVHDLVDITSIESLIGVTENDKYLIIGAVTPHAVYVKHPSVRRFAPSLVSASNSIGSPQIRNRGTIGGNICTASPAGDTITPLFALNALLRLQGLEGVHELPIQDVVIGPGEVNLKRGEIVTHILIPKLEDYQQIYLSLRQRKTLACNKVSIALVIQQTDQHIMDIRIALGAVAPTVIRVSNAERYLKTIPIPDIDLKKVETLVCQAANPIDDVRSNKEYRRAMTGILFRKAYNKLFRSEKLSK
ncbi:MAG: FAD binding domain-containing protein [Promethearchaeota archaeon]